MALCRGHQELESDLDGARHPHPARSVIALARRARPAAAGAALSRLRHARHPQAHHGDRLRLFLVHPHTADHREGVRAIRFGAESGSHRQELAESSGPRAGGRSRPGQGVHGQGRRFHRRARAADAGEAHERDSPAAKPLLELETIQREIGARDRQLDNPFSKDMQITAIRAARALSRRPADPHRQAAQAARSGRWSADCGAPQHPDPQDAGRPADRSRQPRAGCRWPAGAGLYAAGEVAGFGGGGVHGYAALEGTFLGGCIFSGRAAGGRRRGAWLELRHPSRRFR